MTISTPVYLLKNSIDFTTESTIRLMEYSFPDTKILLKEESITGDNLKHIVDRLSLSKDNMVDVEYFDSGLKFTMDSLSFFKKAIDVFTAHQYKLECDGRINFMLMSLINKGDCSFPHFIEISCGRATEKVEEKVSLSSILKNMYFEERSDIISGTLSIENAITDAINASYPNETIQRASTSTIKNISINKSTLEEKINFLRQKNMTDDELTSLLHILRKLRNNAAHDLSLTESVYSESIFKLTSEFICRAENRYRLDAINVARFNKCIIFLFDEICGLVPNKKSKGFSLGTNNCNEWKSFFYGV
ncbi:DUF4145 domain-containing protein [Aeromonas media]|uniref:DUF4145 domain-containing protein n=1 Tax=Aeromonas media TaxID=651 RepID=UPI0038502EC3